MLEKLGVKPGQVAALIGVEDASFGKQLEATGVRLGEPAQVVFLQVRTKDDLKKLARLRKALPDDGVLWLLRPKAKMPQWANPRRWRRVKRRVSST